MEKSLESLKEDLEKAVGLLNMCNDDVPEEIIKHLLDNVKDKAYSVTHRILRDR